jgi:dipeptidyl aminopeptidase/acylaminoacyl peptidase
MMVFVEQGYVVVAFTGSFGFGQAVTDRIQNQWGGLPYQDLVLGWEYIGNNLPYVNTYRARIQGNGLGRKFKALFTHDGVFNTLSQYASEELWFMQYDFNGTLWDNWDNYARWNPANHTEKWATPHLIVNNEKDYSLPISEGWSAFNELQTRGGAE